MESEKIVRTRIAPSPTGYPHIGTIYQALFNYAFAKKNNGRFVVRIEDTDRARFVEGAEDVIFNTLDWVELEEDESPRRDEKFGPYRQSERLAIYHKYVQALLDLGHAYFAFVPKADSGIKKNYKQQETLKIPEVVTNEVSPKNVVDMLQHDKKNWVVRMHVPKDKSIVIHDEIRGDITFDPKQVTEQILLKSDGFPTYHLAVVVDDHLMEISDVVRAEEWIPSTPKHQLLYDYFGWTMPKTYHTPDLRNPDKSKLSKRQGHTDVRWYKEEGYLPEAMLNYLALLGWTHPEEKEIFSLEEFIKLFDLKDIRAVAPIFDLQKLTWMNGEYIRQLSDEALKQKLMNFYKNDQEVTNVLSSANGNMFVSLGKLRIKTLKDFKILVEEAEKPKLDTEQKHQVKKVLEHIKSSNIDWNNTEALLVMLKELKLENISMKNIYYYIMYKEQGLPLIELMQFWGKEETIARLQSLL